MGIKKILRFPQDDKNEEIIRSQYNSGFQVHSEQKINGANGDRIEKIARYMSRAAISVERVEFNPEENTVTIYEKQNKISSAKKAHYEVFEFMALLEGIFPHPTKRSLIIMASIAVLIEARREKKKEERAQWRGNRSKERLKPARVGHG